MNDKPDKAPLQQALVFDFGERRIGVASANALTGVAGELVTLSARNGQPQAVELDALLRDWQPEVLVIGLPYNEDGSESPMSKRANEFATWLGERYQLPTQMVDERFTSAEAESILRSQRQSGLRKRRTKKQDIDRLAARLIAESWLRGAGNKKQHGHGS